MTSYFASSCTLFGRRNSLPHSVRLLSDNQNQDGTIRKNNGELPSANIHLTSQTVSNDHSQAHTISHSRSPSKQKQQRQMSPHSNKNGGHHKTLLSSARFHRRGSLPLLTLLESDTSHNTLDAVAESTTPPAIDTLLRTCSSENRQNNNNNTHDVTATCTSAAAVSDNSSCSTDDDDDVMPDEENEYYLHLYRHASVARRCSAPPPVARQQQTMSLQHNQLDDAGVAMDNNNDNNNNYGAKQQQQQQQQQQARHHLMYLTYLTSSRRNSLPLPLQRDLRLCEKLLTKTTSTLGLANGSARRPLKCNRNLLPTTLICAEN